MKLSIFLIFLGIMQLSASTYSQKLNLKFTNASLKSVMNSIRMQTDYSFLFDDTAVEKVTNITVEVQNASLEETLQTCLRGTNFSFKITEKTIILFQEKKTPEKKYLKIQGKVTDIQKRPIPGVTVQVKTLKMGTATDKSGKYLLEIPKTDNLILVFSFIGMETQEIKYTGKDTINIILKEKASELNEIQVISTGYYNVDKRHLTSSVTSLKAADVLVPGMSSIDQMLEGHVPGMIFMQNSGQVGVTPKLKIRGTTTLLGSQAPLWVVDGVILSDPVNVDPQQINDLDFVNLLGNAISGLNPEDIEQIDILKDASATAIYGPRASNGVIVITTKKGKVGAPSVSYSVSSTFRQRPYYSDRAVNVMNSKERINFSRELMNKELVSSRLSSWVGYEAAAIDLYNGVIDFKEFNQRVVDMETCNTDWFGILLKNSFSHNHTLSLSGGSENVRYYTSLGYMDENGNIRKESSKRFAGRANIDVNYNKFQMQFQLNGNLQKKRYTPQEVQLMNYAYNTSRSIRAYTEEGDLWFYQRDINSNGYLYDTPFSIINERDNTHNKIKTDQVNLNVVLGYNFIPALRTQVQFSYGISHTEDETYFGEDTWYAAKLRKISSDGKMVESRNLMPKGGELRLNNTKQEDYRVQAQVTFTQSLDKERTHILTLMVNGEISSSRYTGFAITRRGYMPERGLIFDAVKASDPNKPYTDYNTWLTTNQDALGRKKDQLTNLASLFGVATYTYKNTYILNGNIRIDASNKFGDKSNDRLLPIWSASARWNLHENVLRNSTKINTFALKLSYGFQGNMSAQDSPKLQLRKQGIDDFFGEYYSEVESFPNPFLKWEKTSTFNAEIEFALFNEKVSGTVSYYYRHSSDVFMSKTVSPVNGMRTYTVNKGTLVNQGYDFSLSIIPINTMLSHATVKGQRRGFVWRFDPNFGAVLNQLINKLKYKDKVLQDEITYDDYLNGKVRISGKPVGTFYSYRFKGLNPESGIPMFYGTEPTMIIDGKEVSTKEVYEGMQQEEVFMKVMKKSGTREPFLQGGVSNSLGWRNWTLSFNLAYSIGSKIRLFNMFPNGLMKFPGPETNLRKEFVNHWQKPGDEAFTNVPGLLNNAEQERLSTDNVIWWNGSKMQKNKFGEDLWIMYDNSDLRVVSGNYLKLQNISLRFVVPENFCKKIGVRSAYASITGANVFTLCSRKLKGQDPSQSGTSSTMNLSIRPTYTLQLNLTF